MPTAASTHTRTGRSEAQGPRPVDVPPSTHLTTTLWERAGSSPDQAILRPPAGDGEWRDVTWGELAERVRSVAAGLVASGVAAGDRVALMSPTRVEWTVADLAVLAAGAVTVPIYDTSSAEQCEWILSDSGAVAAFAAGSDERGRLEEAWEEGTEARVLVFDDGALDELARRGGDAERAEVERRCAALTTDDLATIVYTSGTTGNPKGCMLTHGNLVWTARQTREHLGGAFGEGDSTLLFLPLAHVFARLIQVGCLESGVVLGYARSMDTLADDLRSFRPTFLLSVPRVFEKVFNRAQSQATGVKARVFDFAVRSGRAWSEAGDPGPVLRLRRALADKLVYAKLRQAVGGRVKYAVSGGSALSPHLAHFFHAAGIPILEGYGLTETSAPATANAPDAFRIGTVGRPLPGVELRIAADGEILIRGPHVFQGYWQNDEATAAVLDQDGWFHSEDLGTLDDDGFLSITGRKKELIVTAGGKNVAPSVLEERIKSHRLVSQAIVIGDDRPFIAALVTLDPDEAEAFARERGLSTDPADLAASEEVRGAVGEAIEAANRAVSRAESIREFRVLPRDLSQDEDEITPTLKVKRSVVAEHFAEEIEAIYRR